MGKKSIGIILTGSYFILTGTLLLLSVRVPEIDFRIKKDLYARVQARLTELDRSLERGIFYEQSSLESFHEHRSDLSAAMREFKIKYADKVSFGAVLTAAAGTLMGLVYFVTGIGLIGRFSWSGKTTVAGFCLWGVVLALFMWSACIEIRFMDYTSVELWQMAALVTPQPGDLKYKPLVKSLFDFSVTRTAFFAAGWTIFFLLAPLYGLMRPQVGPFWRKQEIPAHRPRI